MVAISVEIAANNLRAANNALKVASQLLADMRKDVAQQKKDIIDLITGNSSAYQIPLSYRCGFRTSLTLQMTGRQATSTICRYVK